MTSMKRLLGGRHFARMTSIFALSALLALILAPSVLAQCEWQTDFVGNGLAGTVNVLTVWDGDLYAGGNFLTAGGVTVNRVAKWDGTTWSALTGPSGTGVDGVVQAMAVWNGDLYVGGTFTNAGGVSANRIAKWDGTAWSSLSTGMNNEVWALHPYGGELVAGGKFITAGGVSTRRIAKWDGTTWSSLSGPSGNGMDLHVWTLEEWNGSLYAGGKFTEAGGTSANFIAEWNGTQWANLPIPSEPNGLTLDALAITTWDDPADGSPDTALYIAGWFSRVGTPGENPPIGQIVNRITKWDGTDFHSLTGPSAIGLPVHSNGYSLTTWDDGDGEDLYCGGNFPTAGGVEAGRVASWDGVGWSGLEGETTGNGVGVFLSYAYALATWDDGTGEALYVGGDFLTTVGGIDSAGIAKFACGLTSDVTAPINPSTFESSSHTMGVPSALNIITASWSGAADADSGLAGYSVLFDDQPTTQPDDVVDVPHTTDPHSVMSAALADGMWYFHLSACDVAGNCSVATHLGPFVIDTTMPSLTAYDTVADTGDGSLSANEVTSSPITQVLVSFNEDLDTATAQNLGNWGLISAGANGTIDSSACAVSGDDVNVGATAATLLGDLQTVRLDVGGGSSLAGDLYRLSACSGITDLAGNALANSTIDFTVAVDNLIPNPNFDDELAPWIAGGTRPQDLAWGGVDAEGKATSGALEVSTTSGTSATTSAEVCVDVPAGMPTLLAGSLEVLDGSGGDPVVTLELIASDMPGCATASATSGAVTIASGPTAGQDFVVRAPAGTWTSVLARFTVTGGASSTHTVRIDVLEGLLFADGFECGPGSICQWSSEVP